MDQSLAEGFASGDTSAKSAVTIDPAPVSLGEELDIRKGKKDGIGVPEGGSH